MSRIIVGVDVTGHVGCVPEAEASLLVQLWKALSGAKTWREFRQLAPEPYLSEAEERASADGNEDAPGDAQEFDMFSIWGVGDGDWPPLPQQVMIGWLPKSVLAMGEIIQTVYNGPILEIEAHRIDAVVAALGAVGFEVRRSDEIVREMTGS
jgi:hypothetical protein